MSEFDKNQYISLRENFDQATNRLIGNISHLQQNKEDREKFQFELVLTFNNLVVFVNNHLQILYVSTHGGIGKTIQQAREKIEHCARILQLPIVLPVSLFDRIKTDIFDFSIDQIPSDFENSNNTEFVEVTNGDFLTSNNMNFNLTRYSTPIRNQGERPNMATNRIIPPTDEQISPNIHDNGNDHVTIQTTIATDCNPIYTTAQIQPGTQINHIQATAQTNQQQPILATHQNMSNRATLNQIPLNQIQLQHIDNFQPITSTNHNINTNNESPLNRIQHQHNESPRAHAGPNNNTQNPFLPPQAFSTQYTPFYQNQAPMNECYGLMMRSTQVLEQQSNQLQQAARFNETLIHELRIQRESYQQLIHNQMAINQNHTQQQNQTTTGTKPKIRAEYREILKSIPDFDGEKYGDLDNILHAAELAYSNADNLDEMNAFYLTLKLHLKGHVYKTIYQGTTAIKWEDIREILNTEFSYLKPDKGLIKKQLETARQLETETIDSFAKRITKYANQKRSSYNSFTREQEDDLNDQMIKTLTGGIKTEKIKNKLSFFGSNKFFDYVTRAIELERNLETEILNREFYCNYCNKNGHREITCRSKQEQNSGLNQLSKLFGNLNTRPKFPQLTPNANQTQNPNQFGRNQTQNNTSNFRNTSNTGIRNNNQNNQQSRSMNAANSTEADDEILDNIENHSNNTESDSQTDSEN